LFSFSREGDIVQKLFSTKNLHPRDAFDCWHEVACKEIVNHKSRPESRRGFQAELEGGSLAEVGLLLFENSPMEVSHTKQEIANSNSDDLFFCCQVAGSILVEQCSCEALLKAGNMLLLDPMLPYTAKFAAGSRSLVFKVPRQQLEARAGKARELIAIPMNLDKGEHALTSSFLVTLPAHLGEVSAGSQSVLKEQAIDLMALALAKATESRPRLSSSRSLILMSLKAAVDARLSDPALDVKTVAVAAGVSVRYANSLLAQENTSLMRLIQTRRLARCLKALEDPSQSQRTVSEIAYSWGFSDMTHFGRIFKKAYGVLPSEYRRRIRKTGRQERF
jgi:AraC family transcriptional regulator, positive regulator of tynA and feaB